MRGNLSYFSAEFFSAYCGHQYIGAYYMFMSWIESSLLVSFAPDYLVDDHLRILSAL